MSCVATRLRAVRKFIKIGATRGAESQLASDGAPPVDGPELFTGHHGDPDLVLGPHLYLWGRPDGGAVQEHQAGPRLQRAVKRVYGCNRQRAFAQTCRLG